MNTKKLNKIIIYVILILLALLCLVPFYMLFIQSTRSHPDIQKGFSALPGSSLLPNLRNVLNNDTLPVLRGMFNSLVIAAASSALATYFSAMTAYGVHAYNFKGKKTLFNFILMIMLVPAQVSALGFINQMQALGLRDSFIPLIVPAIASPTVVFFMKQYMTSALPLEIIEAARIDGSSEFMSFNRIVIPIMRPAFAVQGIFTFVYSWNNYFMPSLLLDSKDKKTLPILIAQLRGADFLKFDMGQVYTLISLAILPTIIVYILLSRHIIGGITDGGVKG